MNEETSGQILWSLFSSCLNLMRARGALRNINHPCTLYCTARYFHSPFLAVLLVGKELAFADTGTSHRPLLQTMNFDPTAAWHPCPKVNNWIKFLSFTGQWVPLCCLKRECCCHGTQLCTPLKVFQLLKLKCIFQLTVKSVVSKRETLESFLWLLTVVFGYLLLSKLWTYQ